MSGSPAASDSECQSRHIAPGYTFTFNPFCHNGSGIDREVYGSKGGVFVGSAYIRAYCGSYLC